MNWGTLLSGFWGGIKPYVSDPMAWLGAAGTGAGIYDIIRRQSAEKDYLNRQKDWMRRVEATANAPLNVEAIYNPGKATIQRDLESGLAERGLQPGGAWNAAMGEGMMKQWLNAAQIAQAQRGNQLSAMSGTGPVRPNYPGVGDTSALGKYLQFIRQSKDAERARTEQKSNMDQLLEMMREQRRPWWGSPGPGEQSIGMPPAPDVYKGMYDEDM